MAYIVIRTINGRRYRYLQISYREGKKVRTIAQYLGPADSTVIPRRPRTMRSSGLIGSQPEPYLDEEAMLREARARDRAHAAMIERFEATTGLRMGPRDPVPVEKPVPTVGDLLVTSAASSKTPSTADEPSEEAAPVDAAPGR